VPTGTDAAPVVRLAARLAEQADDVVVFVSGSLDVDGAAPHEPGVARGFPRDAGPADVVDWLRSCLRG
jgi:hypothetical protein